MHVRRWGKTKSAEKTRLVVDISSEMVQMRLKTYSISIAKDLSQFPSAASAYWCHRNAVFINYGITAKWEFGLGKPKSAFNNL
ncbi:hypothetical protein RclHR1_28260002 [Rhizophagus clarus]|uniref:Uncharacterized protein n=1 Tax=Rhizophagus clarus TaxID=94130 RepID=A0A2Z6RH89_9GLOM|nr:hypothetical protein RclHR1_28260002 [Rhizophagus clarus]